MVDAHTQDKHVTASYIDTYTDECTCIYMCIYTHIYLYIYYIDTHVLIAVDNKPIT